MTPHPLAIARRAATLEAMTLPVSEVFGPVWQGEGPHAGRICSFVRLGLCNLSCSWCDTPYTWDTTRYDVKAECPDTTVPEIVSQLDDSPMVVLSGGEPLIHQAKPAWHELLEHPREWHVETNGTIAPSTFTLDHVTHFTVSPKLDQGDPVGKRLKPKALEVLSHLARQDRAIFKVVVRDQGEVEEAAHLFDHWEIPQRARWVMPEGTTPEDVLTTARWIAPVALDYGLNLSLRQQTLLYGQERGR